jgi:ATP-dependent Lhr-like helicase
MTEALAQLHPGLREWVMAHGWSGLRPIQEAALEPILGGEHCVVEAPTAGGKTEAVLFPTLSRAGAAPRDSVQILYLAPLRALLNNLELRAIDYARACGLNAFKWHGDVDQKAKVESLTQPPQLLLTTPESLEAILLRKAQWHRFFAGLETVIIDEAHNFAAGDRGGHLLSLLERLRVGTGRDPQRIALSATIGNPDAMTTWLVGNRAAGRRIHVEAESATRIDYAIDFFNSAGETEDTPLVEQASYRLLERMSEELAGRRGLVFVRSRTKAEEFAKSLQTFTRKFTSQEMRIRTHHSAVSRYFREDAERLIQMAGEEGVEAIISTSTLELGVDIGELDRVLQIGALASSSAFLQRVGRTGRRQGKPRHFRGLALDAEELLLLTATTSLGMEHQADALRLPRRSFHLLAHQVMCLSLQENGVSANAAWSTLRAAHIFSGINTDEFMGLIEFMLGNEYLRQADGVLVPGDAAEKRFLMAGWRSLFAVFNTAPLYDVLEGGNQVGTLDVAFVEGLKPPFYFTLAGRLWQARAVDYERRTIKAVRARDGMVPRWQAFGGPDVPYETAQRAGELLHGHRALPDILEASARDVLEALCMAESDMRSWQPGGIDLVAGSSGRVLIRTYAGDRINRTLARLLEAKGFQTSGNYAEVTLQPPKGKKDPDLLCATRMALDELRTDAKTSNQFDGTLEENQSTWPFSPFAVMLPESLKKSALVDATLDPEGLAAMLVG